MGELKPELVRPGPDRLIADLDPALRQQFLDVSEAESEPEIQPDGVADDLTGVPIAGIAGASRCHHPTRLPAPVPYRKRAGR